MAISVKIGGFKPFQAVTGLSGAVYTADAQGFITVTVVGDVNPFINAGYTFAGLSGVNNNYAATVDPAATNDSSQDYGPGSVCVNASAAPPRVWVCVTAAVGAAVWQVTSLPVAQYTSISSGNGTLAAGAIEGAQNCTLATSGATALTTRTAAQMIAQIGPAAIVGLTFFVEVYNTNGGTLTLTGGTGVTITGTATIATTKARAYMATITGVGASAAITLQNLGSYTAD